MFPTLIDNMAYLLLLQFLGNKGHVPNEYLIKVIKVINHPGH